MEATTSHVTVFVPEVLRERTGGARRLQGQGATVAELIASLEHQYPGMRFHLCFETGELRQYVNLYVNGVHVRYLQGLETPLPNGAEVRILPSVAGG